MSFEGHSFVPWEPSSLKTTSSSTQSEGGQQWRVNQGRSARPPSMDEPLGGGPTVSWSSAGTLGPIMGSGDRGSLVLEKTQWDNKKKVFFYRLKMVIE